MRYISISALVFLSCISFNCQVFGQKINMTAPVALLEDLDRDRSLFSKDIKYCYFNLVLRSGEKTHTFPLFFDAELKNLSGTVAVGAGKWMAEIEPRKEGGFYTSPFYREEIHVKGGETEVLLPTIRLYSKVATIPISGLDGLLYADGKETTPYNFMWIYLAEKGDRLDKDIHIAPARWDAEKKLLQTKFFFFPDGEYDAYILMNPIPHGVVRLVLKGTIGIHGDGKTINISADKFGLRNLIRYKKQEDSASGRIVTKDVLKLMGIDE